MGKQIFRVRALPVKGAIMESFGHITSVAAGILLAFAAVALGAPPKVVRTVPENGADNVNPKLRQIRIVFDQDMDQRGYSICGGGPKYPKTVGNPRWGNKRTIVMRVRLAANHDYELSVNCPSYKHFTNIQGEAVEPYPIKFRTGALKKGEAEEPEEVYEGPPVVVETVPENGERDVDPALKEIRIVFDRDMEGGYSICDGPRVPEASGKPRWIDKRTFSLRVKLAPRREYEIYVNCPNFKNFRSVDGKALEPHTIRFSTAAARAKAEGPSADDNKEAIQELRRAIDEDYSYRDLRKVNWDELFDKFGPAMEQAKDARAFAEAAAALLAHAEDAHIWVRIDDETVGGFRREIKRNYNMEVLKNIVPGWQQHSSVVYTGRFADGIGYIHIGSWGREHTEALNQAYEAIWEFSDAPGLIIDVRSNGGGAEPLAQDFAGCFVDEPKVYAQHVYRSADAPGGFGQVSNRVLEPNKHRPRYRGKVAVLMGPANMSSCEAFLLMMKQVPGCKLVGERSYGSSGNPTRVNLGNGVSVFLPSWKAMRPDGTCFEAEGIRPDVIAETSEVELISRDPVLEAALKLLRNR
jgi:hypothetical protein